MTARRTSSQIVDAVADAAQHLFRQRSPSAVPMREIASTAGVNLGLIHRYVGSKDDVIALVLDRHSRQARSAISVSNDELLDRIADVVVTRPTTGPLIAGLILDGVDVSRLKGDFPLLDELRDDGAVRAAITCALALGWETFGPALLEAVGVEPDPDELKVAIADALRATSRADH